MKKRWAADETYNKVKGQYSASTELSIETPPDAI